MRIALVQQQAGPDIQQNISRGLQAVRDAAQEGAELIAFAELAFTPFYPQLPAQPDHPRLAETIPGPTTDAFAELAKELAVVIILNLYEKTGEHGPCFDSSPILDTDGSLLGITRMVHITEYEHFHEQGYYTPGDQGAAVFETAVGKIGVAICYDRHYPEYMRALAVAGAELVIIPQAGATGEWPSGLYQAELRVAAFQNGYFTALCNRVGQEQHLDFAGESFICNPTGHVLAQAGTGTEEILYCDLDLSEVRESHAHRLFLRDRRPELYPGWLGP